MRGFFAALRMTRLLVLLRGSSPGSVWRCLRRRRCGGRVGRASAGGLLRLVWGRGRRLGFLLGWGALGQDAAEGVGDEAAAPELESGLWGVVAGAVEF